MNISPQTNIPGTILQKSAMGNVTGLEFLHKIFYISQGIMLSQIREIAGIDGSTLQNWTKRGWVANARLKKYSMEQLSRILIINMLRDCMQLDHIIFLLRYLNGEDEETAIIRESELYDCMCRIIDGMAEDSLPAGGMAAVIDGAITPYANRVGAAKSRLTKVLEIFTVAYCAASMKKQADALYSALLSR
ncbi:MAG: DUF1836 domain-containing protein [Ruminococcaceae bacterium]|nr:DUF1836 domain-containing protein [Oscillospiraceae bacterium]